MGRKHIRTGKYLFICIAGVILLLNSGCAVLKDIEKRKAIVSHLQQARVLAAEGRYAEAVRENQKVLMFTSGSPGDQALFNNGLIYVNQDNPEKNYKEARDYFGKVIENYPGSQLAEQSELLIALLEKIETPVVVKIIEKKTVTVAAKPVNDEEPAISQKFLTDGNFSGALKENKRILKSSNKNRFKAEALFNIALVYAHYDNPDKDYEKSVVHFEQLIREYPGSPLIQQAKIWRDVLNVIEKAKQVDIELEKKKKELKR